MAGAQIPAEKQSEADELLNNLEQCFATFQAMLESSKRQLPQGTEGGQAEEPPGKKQKPAGGSMEVDAGRTDDVASELEQARAE